MTGELECAIIEPLRGKKSNKLWMRNKEIGNVSQFARGKRLLDYRKTIEEKE